MTCPTNHDRLDEDGYCRACGVDMRSGVDMTAQSGDPEAVKTYRDALDRKTPDTPESLALWVWDYFVGCPITEPYDATYLQLLERLKFMHRATFTAGLHEGVRQMKGLKND